MGAGASADICTSLLKCIFDFQTAFSGMVALLAAGIGAAVLWRVARLPILQQESVARAQADKRQKYVCSRMSSDLQDLAIRARQAQGTIEAVIAANSTVSDVTRQKTRLKLSPLVDDWESMALLPSDVIKTLLRLRNEIEHHNFDMDRAGGAFGSDNFRQSILSRLLLMPQTALAIADSLAAIAERTKG